MSSWTETVQSAHSAQKLLELLQNKIRTKHFATRFPFAFVNLELRELYARKTAKYARRCIQMADELTIRNLFGSVVI